MATYNGADKRLQYLFSHIGDGSNMSGTAQPTGTAVDNTLYIQYDANDGSVVALWVYLNGTWTEVETAGGNLYGTDEPTDEADEGALYIQYDDSDYSVTALWAYIGAGWREISLGGGGGASGGARYTETVLWSGVQSTNGTITLSDSIYNYDLLLITFSETSFPNAVKGTMMIATSKAIPETAEALTNRYWRFNAIGYRYCDFSFTSETEISLGAFNENACMLEIMGIKWEIQETALIYSEEEREVGVWTDGKPLYQRTFHTSISGTTLRYDTGYGSVMQPKVVSYRIEKSDQDDSDSTIVIMPTSGSTNYINGFTIVNGVIGASKSTAGAFGSNNAIDITVRFTKTTDVAGSGTYITTGGYAHHYSTTEHVVGTWIDGSTLYEITVATGGSVPSDATTLIDRRAMSGAAYDVLLYLK